MEEFLDKDGLKAALKMKLGPIGEKSPMAWLNSYDAQVATSRGTQFSKILSNIADIVQPGQEIVAFSEGNVGWATKGDKLLSFKDKEKMIQDLTMEVLYGAESYFLFPTTLEWMIALCYDEDIHVAGSKEFIESVKSKLEL